MRRRIHLLDADPDLAEGLEGEREALARRHLVVAVERVEAGQWAPRHNEFRAVGGIGLLILDGLALRQLSLGHRSAAELLGPGEVLRPWEDDGEHAAYPFSASFRVLSPLTLGILDEDFTRRLMSFPEVVSRLMGRVMAR